MKWRCVVQGGLAAFCGLAGLLAEESAVALPAPYTASEDNQLMCLGAPKGPRFAVKEISWPEKVGDAEICLWKDDRYASVSITIDDNCAPDQPWWLEQCRKYGFRVTWFVITGGVQGKGNSFNGTWEGYRKLVEAGHAVESHTLSHKSFSAGDPEGEMRKEYGGSRQMIDSNIGISGYRCLALAYPNGKGVEEMASQYFIAVRGVNGVPNPANAINYANTRKGGLSPDQIHAVLGEPIENPKLKWLAVSANRRGWLAPLYHLVYHGNTKEEREASRQQVAGELENLARYKDRLWIDTFVAVAKYGQERDSATLKSTGGSPEEIRLTLTDRMRDDLFDEPLTVKVRLPDGWQEVRAVQNGVERSAQMVTHEGHNFALLGMVPDKGELVVRKK